MTASGVSESDRRGRGVNRVILLTVLCAIGMTWAGWAYDGAPHDYVALVVLTVLTIGTRVSRVRVVERVAVASSGIVSLACCVLVGPLGSALMMATTILFERGTTTWRARLFNASMGSIVGAVGGLTFLLVGGPRDLTGVTGPGPLMWQVGLPFVLANLVFSLVNFAVIALIVRVDSGESFRSVFSAMLTTSGLAQIGYGVIGLLFVFLWVPANVGPFSAVLILLPLFVAQWAFVQYAEEERSHERTLSALVTAGETRDPYAQGHSTRVASLAVQLGEALGVSPGQQDALRYAAILHDTGWLGVRARATEHGELPDQAAQDSIRGHAEAGVALLSEISFLADSFGGIRHHHERWDGRGYPDGLAAEGIPLFARIIAVADALDSLTRATSAREALSTEEALEDLRDRAGTHLDPSVVQALSRVLEAHAWRPADPDVEVWPPQWHHDDPTLSDLLANVTAPRAPAASSQRGGAA